MPRDGARHDSDSTADGVRPNRRSYLKAAGAAAVSVPLFAGEGAAATERHGISFDTVVDMVDDAGCDPSGNEPCDGALRSAAGSDTLLKFPSGTYRLTGKNSLNGYSNFGILGEGDVTFVVPEDSTAKVININYGTDVLVENITVDHSDATPTVQVAPNDGLAVHGLEMRGQGIGAATGEADAPNAFNPMVRSSGGEGLVEDIVLHNEGRMGSYSRTGVWVGAGNEGTLTLRNCNVEGFSGNGVYASRTPGVVQVEGGTYRNNDISQVRIGSSGSYVDGAAIETDLSESRSPNPGEMLNGSGIRLESDRGGSGAEIRNCDVRVGPNVDADGGIQVFSNYGDFTIENTRVEYNTRGYSIRAKSADDPESAGGTFRNVSVTGEASDFVGVLIEDRFDTVVENCCIQQTGGGRTGLVLDNCDGSRVANCTINASAQPLRIRNGNVAVSGIDESGTCPAPSLSGSNDGGANDVSSSRAAAADDPSNAVPSTEDSDDASPNDAGGAGSDDELSGDIAEADVPEPSRDADLVITDTDTSGGRIPYEFTASGDVDKATAGGATSDSNDEVSGNTADGGVNTWRDAYGYEGEILELTSDGRATIKLDADERTITMYENDGTEPVDYSIEVSGTLEHADDSSEDHISNDGTAVDGALGNWSDTYRYTGRLIQASIEDSVSLTTDIDTLDE